MVEAYPCAECGKHIMDKFINCEGGLEMERGPNALA